MNQFNRSILPVLACLLLVAASVFAVVVEQMDATGFIPSKVGVTNPLNVTPPAIADPEEVPLTVATGTVTYLQSVASWTAGDTIFFHARAKSYWRIIRAGATTTAALLQARGTPIESGDTPPTMLIDPATCDLAFVADTAAAASVTVTIGGR